MYGFLASLSSLPLTISLLTNLHFLKAETKNLHCQLSLSLEYRLWVCQAYELNCDLENYPYHGLPKGLQGSYANVIAFNIKTLSICKLWYLWTPRTNWGSKVLWNIHEEQVAWQRSEEAFFQNIPTVRFDACSNMILSSTPMPLGNTIWPHATNYYTTNWNSYLIQQKLIIRTVGITFAVWLLTIENQKQWKSAWLHHK